MRRAGWPAGVYEDLAPPLRRRLHEAAFRALARGGVHPAEAAEHAIAARLAGDPEAVATLARAGREALGAGAVRTARRHLEAASELAGDNAAPDLLLDLGRALIADGAAHAAIGVCEQLLLRSELAEATRITALGQLARAAFIAGQVELAETCFENAVGLAEESHRDLALQALLDHAFFRLVDGPRPPLPLLERARRLAARPPAPLGACAAAAWGGMAYLCGDGRGLAVAEKAAESAGFKPTPAAGGVHWVWDPVIIYAQLCTWTERFAKAERLFREVLSRTVVRLGAAIRLLAQRTDSPRGSPPHLVDDRMTYTCLPMAAQITKAERPRCRGSEHAGGAHAIEAIDRRSTRPRPCDRGRPAAMLSRDGRD